MDTAQLVPGSPNTIWPALSDGRMGNASGSARAVLAAFVEEDKRQAEAVKKRREDWPSARQTLLEVLQPIAASVGGDRKAYVRAFQAFENFGSVQFWVGNIPTGLAERDDSGGGSLGVERGAAVVFGQTESGRVSVVYYPFRTELPDGRDGELTFHVAKTVEPSVVSPDWVDAQVRDFVEWAAKTTFRAASPTNERRIGFSPG